jgi:hypothetical protein
MKILVGSVYNQESLKWHETQSAFLKSNTSSEFDHVVFFHGQNDCFVCLDSDSADAQQQHIFGIDKILERFSEIDDYSHCLILDSDAFPIKKKWDLILKKSMEDNDCSVSCPVRFENLDTFFHPCVVFLDRNSLPLDVGLKTTVNLLGHKCDEVVVAPSSKTFPLIKTNIFSPHPVAASIYYDMFYHHGFGSRSFACRSIHVNNYYSDATCPEKLAASLLSNPKSFLSRLMGRRVF